MKKLLRPTILLFSVLSFLLPSQNLMSQYPDWLWSRSSADGEATGLSVATDSVGNSYTCGHYTSTCTWGGFTLTNSANRDIFISKCSPSGTVLWAHGIGNTGDEYATDLAIDPGGNVVMIGRFGSDSIAFESYSLYNSGTPFNHVFIAKYDSTGNILWAKSAPYGSGESIAVDGSGNIYLTGRFGSSINIEGVVLNSTGGDDIFIAKFAGDGTVSWAKSFGGNSDDAPYEISASKNGTLVLTGIFTSSSIGFDGHILNLAGDGSAFLVQFDTTGVAQWAESGGGSGGETWGFGASSDMDGDVFATGYFDSPTCVFGIDTLVNSTGGSSRDIFLVKYDSAGNHIWSRGIGGDGNDIADDLATDSDGNVYLTGYFSSSSIVFGTTVPLINSTSGPFDIFVAKYDNEGRCFWSKKVDGTGSENGYSIDVNMTGIAWITGHYDTPGITFGFTPSLTSPGLFLAKLDSSSLYDTLVATVNADIHQNLSFYPNPSTGQIQMLFKANDLVKLEIFSSAGVRMCEIQLDKLMANPTVIDLAFLPEGIYFLKIDAESESWTRKLVITK